MLRDVHSRLHTYLTHTHCGFVLTRCPVWISSEISTNKYTHDIGVLLIVIVKTLSLPASPLTELTSFYVIDFSVMMFRRFCVGHHLFCVCDCMCATSFELVVTTKARL